MADVLARYGVVVAMVLAVAVPASAVWIWGRRRRGARLGDTLLEAGMAVCTAPWIAMALTPSGTGRGLQLIPLVDLAAVLGGGDALVQTVGNLLVFAGLGALLPLRFRLGGTVRALGVVAGVAATASAVVEALQYALAIGRVSSVDDVVLNTAGAALAALCTRPWWRSRRAGEPVRGAQPAG